MHFCRAFVGLSRRRRYLVGVSGGLDSVFLLRSLQLAGFEKLTVCHLNHGLRGRESRADASFVGKLASKLGYHFQTEEVDAAGFARESKQSIETGCRELRHAFFFRCAGRAKCHRLLLAHHADDQIETMLFQFLRGSGLPGLAGMPESSALQSGSQTLEVTRPLLRLSRSTIEAEARAKGWTWREDQSNQSLEHARNRFRHEGIPALKRCLGHDFSAAVLRAGELLRLENDFMTTSLPSFCRDERLPTRELARLHPALQRRCIHVWLKEQGIDSCNYATVLEVLRLLDSTHKPAKVNLPGNRHARRRSGWIFVES